VENPPKTQGVNQEEIIWETGKEYVPVVISNSGNDAEVFFVDVIKRENVNREIKSILRHNWPYGLWVKGGSDDFITVKENAIVLIVYYFSTAQTELYCGVVSKNEKGKVRGVELSNVRIIECPDAKELSDAITELENKGYWHDPWFYPYTPWIIALAKRLYGIQI